MVVIECQECGGKSKKDGELERFIGDRKIVCPSCEKRTDHLYVRR